MINLLNLNIELFYLLLLSVTLGAQNWKILPTNSFPEQSISFAKAVAIDMDLQGNLYIVDEGNHQVLKFNENGELLKKIGGFGFGAAQFDSPKDIFANSNLNVFVADYNNNRVVRLDKNLNYLSELTSEWDEPYDFEQVNSVALSSQNELFILEAGNQKIVKFDRSSQPIIAFGGIYETYGQLLEPHQIMIGNKQNIFVTEPGQSAIVVYDYLGNFLQNIEHPDLNRPTGIYFSDSHLFVVNQNTADVFVFNTRYQYVERLSFNLHVKLIADIVVKKNIKTDHYMLYALTPQQCWQFELSQKND